MKKSDFVDKFVFLSEKIGSKKYYHLKSVNNFITHFDDFGTMQNKSKVEEILNPHWRKSSVNDG